MTSLEKRIYNTYLRISRSKQNKPYRLRENFDNFENEPNYVYIKQLQLFFEKHKHVKIDDFFNAPYIVYPTESGKYDLKFYNSYNAIKVYSLFLKKLNSMDPDDDIIFSRTVDGVKFIQEFCKDNNLKYSEYFNHTTGTMNSFWNHLKCNDITVYNLFLTDNLYTLYSKSDKPILREMLDGVADRLDLYRSLLYNSAKTRKLINGLKHIFT